MGYSGRFRIADCVFEIHSLYPAVQELCKDYSLADICSSETCDNGDVITSEHAVNIRDIDITNERERSYAEDDRMGRRRIEYSDDYLETLAVYRNIATYLPSCRRLLFHGSAMAFDGKGCVFTAKSGVGKSTHSALWRKVYGERVTVVNDDKPIISLVGDDIRVHGTPWNGKHGLGSAVSVPLKAICFIERATENSISRLSGKDVFYRLLSQTFLPQAPDAMKRTFELVEALSANVDVYLLKCNISKEAVEVCHSGIFGDE